MKKFNYVKWVTENKYGKITEQALTGSVTGGDGNTQVSQTFYKRNTCSPCPSGYFVSQSVSSWNVPEGIPQGASFIESTEQLGNVCAPIVPGAAVEVPLSIITSDNVGPTLSAWETSLDNSAFQDTFGDYFLYAEPNQGTTYCQEELTQNIFQGVCCDQNAQNYGQTDAGSYNIQQDEQNALDISLMTNLFGMAFCDNSICAGAADPGGDPVDAMAPMPSSDKAPFKDKRKEKGPGKPTSALRYREPITEGLLNEVEECTNHYMCPAFMICSNQGFCIEGDINDQAPPSRGTSFKNPGVFDKKGNRRGTGNPMKGCPCGDGTSKPECCDRLVNRPLEEMMSSMGSAGTREWEEALSSSSPIKLCCLLRAACCSPR